MAITDQTLYNEYTTDGTTDTFAFNFCLFREADLTITLDDVVVGSGFTVSGLGTRAGGSVAFDSPPATGQTLLIKLETDNTRSADYQQNGDILADTLDDDIDRLWQAQQYQNYIAGRTITFDDVTATGQEIVGNAATRADKLVGFDGSGDVALLVPADLSLSTVTAFANTLLDDANSAAARTTLETSKAAVTQEGVRYTATGTAPNYVLTPSPAIVAYAAGQRYTMAAHSDGTIGSNTVNISGLGAKDLKQYDDGGNKRSGVIKNGQIAVIEYDGTDFVILNPLPVYPVTAVRHTVQAGPYSSGLPNFLPSTATGTTLTSQNIDSSNPLIVCASQGFGYGTDRIGTSTANLSWTGLTVATTYYLYVDVSSSGGLTTGSTSTKPVYQYSGTPAVTAGTCTFDITKMTMYAGNGSTAPAAWRVFVGEAVSDGANITATVMYAYNGIYNSGNLGLAVSTTYTFAHNVGAPVNYKAVAVCIDAAGEGGYAQYDEVEYTYDGTYNGVPSQLFNYRTGKIGCGALGIGLPNTTTAAYTALTESKWRIKVYVRRAF